MSFEHETSEDQLRIVLQALSAQLDATVERLAAALSMPAANLVPLVEQARSHLQQNQVAYCESCGWVFLTVEGYVEAGEYAYCSDCCHW